MAIYLSPKPSLRLRLNHPMYLWPEGLQDDVIGGVRTGGDTEAAVVEEDSEINAGGGAKEKTTHGEGFTLEDHKMSVDQTKIMMRRKKDRRDGHRDNNC